MMNTIILRNISSQARNIRLSQYPFNSSHSLLSLSKPTFFFSSRSDPSSPPIPHIHDDKQQPPDVEDISNEELKKRVARLREGDEDAIPSVFAAVLQRYLTGKPIEDDQDLMKEILGKETLSEDSNEEDENEFDSDSDLEGKNDIDFEEEEDFILDVKAKSGTNEEKTKTE